NVAASAANSVAASVKPRMTKMSFFMRRLQKAHDPKSETDFGKDHVANKVLQRPLRVRRTSGAVLARKLGKAPARVESAPSPRKTKVARWYHLATHDAVA